MYALLNSSRDGDPISTPKLQLNNSKNNFGETMDASFIKFKLRSLSLGEAHSVSLVN